MRFFVLLCALAACSKAADSDSVVDSDSDVQPAVDSDSDAAVDSDTDAQ